MSPSIFTAIKHPCILAFPVISKRTKTLNIRARIWKCQMSNLLFTGHIGLKNVCSSAWRATAEAWSFTFKKKKKLAFCLIAMSFKVFRQPFVNVKDSISVCQSIWMKLIYSHAFNHAQAFYSSGAKSTHHRWHAHAIVVVWSHVAPAHPADSLSVTLINHARPPSGPCPPVSSLWQWGTKLPWRPPSRDLFLGPFSGVPLILEGLPFIGHVCQLLPRTHAPEGRDMVVLGTEREPCKINKVSMGLVLSYCMFLVMWVLFHFGLKQHDGSG